MSRRQSLPPAARDVLAALAEKLRGAQDKAKARGVSTFPGDADAARAVALGTMFGIVEGAAIDVESLLSSYAPRGR
jgi:hypothetical protein